MNQNTHCFFTSLVFSITICNASQIHDIPSLVKLASQSVRCGYIDEDDVETCKDNPNNVIIQFAKTGAPYLAMLIELVPKIPTLVHILNCNRLPWDGNQYHFSWLEEYITQDNPMILKKLIQWSQEKSIPAQSFDPLDIVLIYAAAKNQIKIVNYLLQQKITVDAATPHNNTPLICGAHHPRIVQTLLAHNANPANSNKAGETTLMLAAQHNAKESVRMLLAAGAPVNAQNHNQLTALDYLDVFITLHHVQSLTEEECKTNFEIRTMLEAAGVKRRSEL